MLEKGQCYDALNDTYIIFICTFELFTGKRHKYTFKNICLEKPKLNLNDGTTKLFLSTKGETDDISLPMKNFLDYVDGHAPADELMIEIDSEVSTAKKREEWRREYMTLALEIEKAKKKAIEEHVFSEVIEMLKDNLPVEKVAKYTSLTIDQIKEIGKKNALL